VNFSETAQILTAMSSYDRRTIGDGDVIAWQAVLSDASFDDCLEAVKRHYAEHTEWMMPAHVRRLVRDITGEREAAARATGWAPGQAGVPKDEAMPTSLRPLGPGERLALGRLSAEVASLISQVRALLPEGSREALAPRKVAWEREQRAHMRVRDGKPNPLYKPGARTSEVCRNASHEHFPGDPVLPSCVFEAHRRLTLDEALAVAEAEGMLDG